jgi:hypothetical protein
VPGALLTYYGTVTNAGNITLTNVVVVNNQSGATPVFTAATLAPGVGASFTGSYLTPTNCSTTSTSTAMGKSVCGVSVTNSLSSTCAIVTTPALSLTQNCPATPPAPGALLTYYGTVTNAGNITLTNVVVLNNQSGATPVFTAATLAPGAGADYSGSFVTPTNCSTTSISTAIGESVCGVAVTNSLSSTCAVATAPAITIIQTCPVTPPLPGGLLIYSGSVSNAGNITLTNLVVLNNLSGITPVLTAATLAPGAVTNYTGSYLAPTNCSSTSLSTATGRSICGVAVTNIASTTCMVATTPGLSITEICPPGPVTAGSAVVFGGVVSNTGNTTLLNVLVYSSQPSNNLPVLNLVSLAPGASAPFTGGYIVLGGSNPATNSTIITNSSGSITTNVVTTIAVSNTVTFTTNTVTPTFGTIDPVVGALTDRFSITNGVKGLMYADQNENWGPTLFYAIRTPGSGADEFVTIAPAGGVTDRLALTSTNYDTLTMSPPDVGYGSMNFYYLRHANNGAATFGEIIAQGASASADLWPVANTGYTGLAFAAANVGYGANLFYYVRNSVTGVAAFGTINPTPGGVETDLYTVGTNFDSLVYVPGAVSDWGTAIFAYLRHDSTGSIIGTINPVTQAVTDRLSLGTNHLSDLTFTATDVGYGPNLFYYIRPASSSVTTNLLTTFTTNTVTTLITNTVTTYVTNSLVSFTPTNTVTAIGMDVCQAGTVTAAANCLGPIAHTAVSSLQPLISVPLLVHGVFSLSLPTVTGESYILQFKNVLTDPAWTDLQTVPGTGGNLSFTNPIPAGQMTRFYRIMITP